MPSASTSQVMPEDTEAERSTTKRASHLPRSLEERKTVTRVGGVSRLKGWSLRMYSRALCPLRRGLMPAPVSTLIMWGRQKYTAYGEVGLNVRGGM